MQGEARSVTSAGYGPKVGLLVALAALLASVALLVPPVPQDPAYHALAERRVIFGIPNFGDVVSNIGFAIVGLLGLAFVSGERGRKVFAAPRERLPYVVFFAGLVLTAAGSAYYHLDPTNQTLVWDRLALIAALMALFSAFIMDRIHARIAVVVMLPLLILLGLGSVVSWHLGETAGHGDLRFYALMHTWPVVLIPLMCWLFRGRHTRGRYLLYIFLWYAAARACELYDHEVFATLGGAVSGHTLKHLLAAAATYMVLAMLRAVSMGPDSRPAPG